MSTATRIRFDPREERVIAGLARWMGVLGRFQIVAAVFVFVVLLGVTGVVTTVELVEPASAGAGEDPLVQIGEVSRGTIAAVVGVVVVLSLIFLRGGMLLLSASDDLEVVVGKGEETRESAEHALEGALGRLRSYFVLESLLMVMIAAGIYAGTIAGWGS